MNTCRTSRLRVAVPAAAVAAALAGWAALAALTLADVCNMELNDVNPTPCTAAGGIQSGDYCENRTSQSDCDGQVGLCTGDIPYNVTGCIGPFLFESMRDSQCVFEQTECLPIHNCKWSAYLQTCYSEISSTGNWSYAPSSVENTNCDPYLGPF